MSLVVFTFKPNKAAFEVLVSEGVEYVFFDGQVPPREWFAEYLRDAAVVVVPPWQSFGSDLMDLAP
ncbi:MAG: hypothetical protein ACP5KB_06975, partial [Thermoprotei archaeon]